MSIKLNKMYLLTSVIFLSACGGSSGGDPAVILDGQVEGYKLSDFNGLYKTSNDTIMLIENGEVLIQEFPRAKVYNSSLVVEDVVNEAGDVVESYGYSEKVSFWETSSTTESDFGQMRYNIAKPNESITTVSNGVSTNYNIVKEPLVSLNDISLINNKDDYNYNWTFNKNGDFSINLKSGCDLTGSVSGSNGGYYSANAELSGTTCDNELGDYNVKMFTLTPNGKDNPYITIYAENKSNPNAKPFWSEVSLKFTKLSAFNGIYLNEETKQLMLVDMDEENQALMQNYIDVDSVNAERKLHLTKNFVEEVDQVSSEDKLDTWFIQKSKDIVTGEIKSEILKLSEKTTTTFSVVDDKTINVKSKDYNYNLVRQPDSLPWSDISVFLKKDNYGSVWTIHDGIIGSANNAEKEEGTYSISLFNGLCTMNGLFEDNGKGYYIDEDSVLSAGCESYGFAEGEYRTKLYSFKVDYGYGVATYIATVAMPNSGDSMAIWSELMVRSPENPIDGVYTYIHDKYTGCVNGSFEKSGCVMLLFVDSTSADYKMVFQKAVAGAPWDINESYFAEGVYIPDENRIESSGYYNNGPMETSVWSDGKEFSIHLKLNEAGEPDTSKIYMKLDGNYDFDIVLERQDVLPLAGMTFVGTDPSNFIWDIKETTESGTKYEGSAVSLPGCNFTGEFVSGKSYFYVDNHAQVSDACSVVGFNTNENPDGNYITKIFTFSLPDEDDENAVRKYFSASFLSKESGYSSTAGGIDATDYITSGVN